MYAILVAGDRIKPHEEAPTDEERIKLHKSMIAYAGTYTIDGGKVVHHVGHFVERRSNRNRSGQIL